jgi:drug/metabolite transporter (DMT)-like permease
MGEFAALLTAFCWAGSSLLFTASSRVLGALNTNRVRLVFAVLFLTAAHFLSKGSLLPFEAGVERWLWLGLSGIIGLTLGDAFLFHSFVLLGTRIATLIMTGVPVISTLIAWIFLGEVLSITKIMGIGITVAGIALVILEQSSNGKNKIKERKSFLLGISTGVGGAICQAVGLVLAKRGMAGNYPALSAVVIRMIIGMTVLWMITLFTGQLRKVLQQIYQNRQALKFVAGGSIIGPVIGVWLSLVSIQATFVGIASTLMALTPVILLPVAKWGYKENLSSRAVLGTLISIVGVTTIFIAPPV